MATTSLLLWVRFAKLVSVLLLAAGTIGASFIEPLETRRRFAYGLAGPGLGLTWTFGFLLAYLTGRPLVSSFVVSALVLSVVGLHGTLYLAGREERRTKLAVATAVLPLVLTTWIMVFRPF